MDKRLKGVVVPVTRVILPLVPSQAWLEVDVTPVHRETAEAEQIPVRRPSDVRSIGAGRQAVLLHGAVQVIERQGSGVRVAVEGTVEGTDIRDQVWKS